MRPTLVFCELVTPAPGVGSAARRRALFLSREAQGTDLVSAPGDFRTAARGGWRYRVRRKPRCRIGARPPGLGRPSAGCPLGDGAGPAGVGGRGRLQEEGLEGVSPEGRAGPAPHLNTGRGSGAWGETAAGRGGLEHEAACSCAGTGGLCTPLMKQETPISPWVLRRPRAESPEGTGG